MIKNEDDGFIKPDTHYKLRCNDIDMPFPENPILNRVYNTLGKAIEIRIQAMLNHCALALCLALMTTFLLLCPSWAQQKRWEEISSLATGGRFYIDMETFQPSENGKLRYNVIGAGQGTNNRASLNEVDCATGHLRFPIESWSTEDPANASAGMSAERMPGPQGVVLVTPRTRLHTLLKSACQTHMPDTQGNW
jgi:hypothetical protein